MDNTYVLTKGAVDDLSEIIRHSNAQWGEAQCRTYIAQLERAATALAKGDGVFKDLSSIHAKLRVARSGRHYIFCLSRPHAVPVILAILHERMDIVARLKDRLA